jgi:hypothetical protein
MFSLPVLATFFLALSRSLRERFEDLLGPSGFRTGVRELSENNPELLLVLPLMFVVLRGLRGVGPSFFAPLTTGDPCTVDNFRPWQYPSA